MVRFVVRLEEAVIHGPWLVRLGYQFLNSRVFFDVLFKPLINLSFDAGELLSHPFQMATTFLKVCFFERVYGPFGDGE